MKAEFDHIVVGGGASGCVVAAELVARGDRKVLLIEGGHSHRHPLIDMPPGIFKLIAGNKYMTVHQTAPQDQLDGRVHDIPQGNVLGGGSSVNAQVYMRGRPSDYAAWDSALANNADPVSWDWQTMLSCFRDMEDNNRLNGELHGVGGPLKVSDPGYVDVASRWFLQSVQQLGVPFNSDFNGASQTGVGFYQFMNRDGQRSSAATAYIDPLRHNPNLTVSLRSRVGGILIENGTACGVRYTDASGAEKVARARSDVIMAAGALITPKLLMLSGIGPADELLGHDIPVAVDLPGVGRNLVDHPEIPMIAQFKGRHGYFGEGEGWRMLRNGLNFKLFGTGPINTVGFEAGAFINPVDIEATPTIQAFCIPIMYLDHALRREIREASGITITTVLCKPRSRGTVKLRSANPADLPVVSPNLLKHPDDMRDVIDGQRFLRRAFLEGPLGKHVERVIAPEDNKLDQASMEAHCKRFVKTDYHPCSTARMGADGDETAVLDSRLRVRGVENLRVCDMSAPPDLIAGNTNALAMVLGKRCADFILEPTDHSRERFQPAETGGV